MSDLRVNRHDDLLAWTAALALSGWPAREQATKPHAVHGQARRLAQFCEGRELERHEAVTRLRTALDEGRLLEEIAADLGRGDQPLYRDFAREAGLSAFWETENEVSGAAVRELRALFGGNPLLPFLAELVKRPVAGSLTLSPNFLYPALEALAVPLSRRVFVLVPPPPAWGESPPWPYAEGVDWVLSHTLSALLRHYLRPLREQLEPADFRLFEHAAATLYLDRSLGEEAGLAYLLHAKHELGRPELALFVDQLQAYLASDARTVTLFEMFSDHP